MGDDRGIVVQTMRIAARPETVWSFWIDSERICEWWGESAELDARPGGSCRVALGGDAVMIGEFVELVPHERLVFTLGWEKVTGGPDVPPGSSLVEVTLAADGDGTVLTLRHTGLPAAETESHESGWAHFLAILDERASAA